MVKEDAVSRIQRLHKEAVAATARRDKAVRAAREAGATWTQLGYALGVSAQAAQKKYGSTQERVQAYEANQARRAAKRAQKARGAAPEGGAG